MSLPTNRIKQIKVSSGTTYDIVPEMLQKNGYSAELPTLSDNGTIAMTGDLVVNETTTQTAPSACTSNGFYHAYSTTNSLSGADANPFVQYHTSNYDFRILTTAYSASYVQQIATDYRSDHIYIRRCQNGTWSDWEEIAKIFTQVSEFGLTAPTTIVALVQAIITNAKTNIVFIRTNENNDTFTDAPASYGTLIIEVGNRYLRPRIEYVTQIGTLAGYRRWEGNIIRSGNTVSSIEWRNVMDNTQTANPNLLINSNFAVNTAGKSSYSGNNANMNDGWTIQGSNATIQVNANKSISIVTTAAWSGIAQTLSDYTLLKGKTITLSANGTFTNGVRICIKSLTGSTSADLAYVDSTDTKASVSFTVPSNASYDYLFIAIYNKTAATNTVNCVKLEVGAIATQYSPPIYELERGGILGNSVSNPNLLINSNFAINQRDGYYAPANIAIYADSACTTRIGTLNTAAQTKSISGTVRAIDSASIVGNSSYRYTQSDTTRIIVLDFLPNTSNITVYGTAGASSIPITGTYTYNSTLNTVTITASGADTYYVEYSLKTTAQTATPRVYCLKSACTSGYLKNMYTIDRWHTGVGNSADICTYDVATKTLTLTNNKETTGHYAYIAQYLENCHYYAGKKITFTANTSSHTGNWQLHIWRIEGSTTTSLGDSGFSTVGETRSYTITMPSDLTSSSKVKFLIQVRDAVTLNWAKLEVGSVATEYAPPLVADELPKCQRYYQKFNAGGTYHTFGVGFVRTSTASQNCRAMINLKTTMRAKPTFSYGGAFCFIGVGSAIPVTAISLDGSSSNNNVMLTITTSTASTAGYGGGLCSYNDTYAYIDFDAEI